MANAAPGSNKSALSSTPRYRVESTSLLQEPATLLPGVPVTRTLNGGETHTFKLSIPLGQYAVIRILHRGIILVATLLDKAGKEIVAINNPAGGHGQILLSTIGEESGEYILRLRSTESWANPGSYELAIVETRSATPADQERISAERTFADGSKQYEKEERTAYLEAQHSYEIALEKWDKLRDDHWRALTRYILGATHARLGDRTTAEQYFLKSLEINVGENDWRLRATTLNDLGFSEAMLGKKDAALDYLNQALSSYQAHDDRRGQASALFNKAYTYARAGEMETARLLYEQALAYRQFEHDKNGELYIINSLGGIYDRLGEPYLALADFAKALEGYRELKRQGLLRDERRLGQAFNNVAVANDKLNRWPEAFENYDQALTIFEAIGDAASQAATLDNIGELHASLGDPEQAIKYYDAARPLMEKVKDPDVAASILTHTGQAHMSQGKLIEALADFDAALKWIPKPSTSKLANAYTNIGAIYALQQRESDALASYETALLMWKSIDDRRGEAATLQKRGELFLRIGDQSKALQDFNLSLSAWKLLADQRGQAAALNGIATTEQTKQQPEAALRFSDEAINISESLRTRVSSQRLRASYFATQQHFYEVNVDLQMELARHDDSQKYLRRAFEASERSRARGLIDLLSENQQEITQGASSELLLRERELRQKLTAKEQAQARLLNGKPLKAQLERIKSDLVQLVTEYDNTRDQIRASHSRYAELIDPQAFALNQIQQQLDADTLLLEYSLGDKRSYIWAVTPDSIQGFELPGRSLIEAAAMSLNKSITERNRQVANESSQRFRRRILQADVDYTAASAALSKLLLQQVAPLLGKKRLVVVADGLLQLVSFAALPAPNDSNVAVSEVAAKRPRLNETRSNSKLLIEDHDIVYEPSASVVALQRRELANRKPAPYAVAVFADPVFDKDDDRVKPAIAARRGQPNSDPSREAGRSQASLTRALDDLGLIRFPSLPRSKEEAESILRIAPKGQVREQLSFDANRANAMSKDLSNYRNIHFATHGVVDFEHPELSGIVLSLIDEQGEPQDGFLRLHDIYNLNLPADLVVLSACQTGIGKQIKGEGLIALTRGFMYAGAQRVVASLWKVDDAATAELMAEFYDQMFSKKLPPAAALRAAQKTLSRRPARRSPYFWAGFFLQGEWN